MSSITLQPELGIIKIRILLLDKNEFLSENQTEGKYEQILDFSPFYVLSGPKCSLNVGPFLTMAIIIKVMCMDKEKVTLAEEFKPKA